MKYLLSSLTDKGRRKNVNQDSVLLRSSNYSGEKSILAVVCDGMGGFEKGELASAEVIRLFSIWFDEVFPEFVNEDQIEEFEDKIYESWELLLQTAHQMIHSYGEVNHLKIGTTVTAMLLSREQYFTAHIGDSRIYEINKQILQLTQDQTFLKIRAQNSRQTEIKNRRMAGVLLQGLGASEIIRPVYKSGAVDRGTIYLLCSDGLGHKVTNEDLLKTFIPEVCDTYEILYGRGKKVIELARERGEQDDISILTICTY